MKPTFDRRTATALLVAAAFFMENLDATVIGTSMNAGMGIAVGGLALSVAEILNGSTPGLAALHDFRIAFWIVAGLALLAIVDCVALPPGAGARVLKAR